MNVQKVLVRSENFYPGAKLINIFLALFWFITDLRFAFIRHFIISHHVEDKRSYYYLINTCIPSAGEHQHIHTF